eukprot:1680351-Pleurochrysis_carterae.AAC.2
MEAGSGAAHRLRRGGVSEGPAKVGEIRQRQGVSCFERPEVGGWRRAAAWAARAPLARGQADQGSLADCAYCAERPTEDRQLPARALEVRRIV